MDNNFRKSKNNIYDKIPFIAKHKKATYIFSALIMASLLFVVSYCVVGVIFNTISKNDTTIKEEIEKPVYNNTKALSNNIKIFLMNDSVIEKEITIGDFKKENNIDTDVSEAFIINYYKENGYDMDSFTDTEAVFIKLNEEVVLEPNKYYIGEEDGYFAIFKSNDKGVLSLERKDSCPVTILSNHPQDLEEIKSFKYSFDTKEEAEMQISQYTS